eukprot:m51a1_g9911 hypothetical protein (2918) ;mRNA; r:112489-126161
MFTTYTNKASKAALVLPNELRHLPVSGPETSSSPAALKELQSSLGNHLINDFQGRFALTRPGHSTAAALPLTFHELLGLLRWLETRVVRWLPDYGCAVLRSQPLGHPDDDAAMPVRLAVLGLDGWQHRQWSHQFSARLREAQQLRDRQRTASTGDQGHQKTPGFVAALALDAVQALGGEQQQQQQQQQQQPAKSPPKAGFTDVGMHTGGPARATGWAPGPRGSPLVVDLYAWEMERHVGQLEAADAKRRGSGAEHVSDVDTAQALLSRLLAESDSLAAEGYAVEGLGEWCAGMRSRVDALQSSHRAAEDAKFALPPAEELAGVAKSPRAHTRPLAVPIPVQPAEAAAARGVTDHAAAARAVGNVKTFKCGSSSDALPTFAGVCEWSSDVSGSAPLKLRAIEQTFWSHCTAFLAGGDSAGTMPLAEVDGIVAAVQRYRSVLEAFLTQQQQLSSDALAVGVPYLRSKEMLVVWAAACLAHRVCATNGYSEVGDYRLPISHESMGCLVLRERAEVDAAKAVASYILRFSRRSGTLWRESDSASMSGFANAIASKDETMAVWRVYLREIDAKLKADHGVTIQRRKNQLATLREQLSVAKEKLREEETSENRTSRSLRRCQRQVYGLESSIAEANRAPPMTVLNLPTSDQDANYVLFFLTGPTVLMRLGRLLWLAQDMLLPRAPMTMSTSAFSMSPFEVKAGRTWRQHVGRTVKLPAAVEDVDLSWGPDDKEPKQPSPALVDLFCWNTQGVWSPDVHKIMTWSTSGAGTHDPFKGTPAQRFTELFYTPELPGCPSDLQWVALVSDASDSSRTLDRANRWIAQQSQLRTLLDWLVAPKALQTFTCLRAGALQQMRRICCLLLDPGVCLSQPAMCALVSHALHHIGPIERAADGTMTLAWHQDAERGDLVHVMCRNLSDFISRSCHLVRESRSALAVAVLCEFVCQWDTTGEAAAVARSAADMCLGWAHAVETDRRKLESASTVDTRAVCELRAKEGLFYGYALLCCRKVAPMSHDEAALMLLCLVRFRASRSFAQSSTLLGELQAVEAQWHHQVSGVIKEYSAHLLHRTLTAALRSVCCGIGDDVALKWYVYGTAYATEHPKTGVIYSINILSGDVLVDGYPLRSLPGGVLQSALYKRTFGSHDFEAVREGNSWKAQHPQGGFFYEFALGSGSVCIRETDAGTGTVLELLDSLEGANWVAEIPALYRSTCSFWAHRKSATIVARPVHFQSRDVSLLVVQRGDRRACCVVPQEKRADPLLSLLSMARAGKFPELVLPALEDDALARLLVVLTKFEEADYIDMELFPAAGEGAQASLRFILPRFGLGFDLCPDGSVASLDLGNYRLAKCQQMSRLLPRFHDYLVLEPRSDGEHMELFIADGTVLRDHGSGFTSVKRDHLGPQDTRRHFSYEVSDRLQELQGRTALSRLHLAAILAASGTLLGDTGEGVPGACAAQTLVQQSFQWSPLTDEERAKLEEVFSFSAGFPALAAQCTLLSSEASALAGLHDDKRGAETVGTLSLGDCESEYRIASQRGLLPAGAALTAAEEARLLGFAVPRRPCLEHATAVAESALSLSKAEEVISSTERSIASLLSMEDNADLAGAQREFPLAHLRAAEGQSHEDLFGLMLRELEDSWKLHSATKVPVFRMPREEVEAELRRMHGVANACASMLHDELRRLHSSQFKPERGSASGSADLAHKKNSLVLSHAANYCPLLTRSAILRSLADRPDALLPLLGRQARDDFVSGAFSLAQLWVLCDKLKRLAAFVADPEQLVTRYYTEFMPRAWGVREHPRWLAFEASSGIQVRPEQSALALHLIAHPGDIAQLNMGLGKTRVVLPLLLLHHTQRRAGPVVRVTFCTQLLRECVGYLQQYLTAGLFRIPVLLLPFNRGTPSTQLLLRSYCLALQRCRDLGGFVALAPEHRLSLALKSREASNGADDGAGTAALFKRCLAVQTVDIVDESDAVLYPKYELVYALGDPAGLESGESRWACVEAVLWALNSPSDELRRLLSLPGVTWAVPQWAAGSFREFRFLRGAAYDSAKAGIKRQVALQLCRSPPHELRWLRGLGEGPREQFVVLVTDSALDAEAAQLEGVAGANEQRKEHVLALRGLLAHEVVFGALEKRHRVDYGVDRTRVPRRSLAVPFRGSDSPAPRAEFSHADSVLALTCLSAYYNGLEWPQLRHAIEVLLGLPSAAAQDHYALWLRTIDDGATTDAERQSIAGTDRLDVTSELQRDVLTRAFARSPAAIDFWLNAAVFPVEMSQFAQRLKQSAWHLAPAGTVGFSGTNDINRVMPLTLRPVPCIDGDTTIAATNGRMLDVLRRSSEVLLLGDAAKQRVCEQLLDCAADQSRRCDVSALIDAGALLAGLSNRAAASRLLARGLPERLRGVVYHEAARGSGCWVVLERSGRCLPLGSSPVHERDTFVLFDEPHARMCKDKFMQGAGRMRALGHGQTLKIVVVPEIQGSIRASMRSADALTREISVTDVLAWVFCNTVQAVQLLLPHWAENGSHYVSSVASGGAPVEPDGMSLWDLYAKGRRQQVLTAMANKYWVPCAEGNTAASLAMGRKLLDCCAEYQKHSNCTAAQHALEEECERELEHEREMEEEKEEEIPGKVPRGENIWDPLRILSACDMRTVAQAVGAGPLSAVVDHCFSQSPLLSRAVSWGSASVWATVNFVFAVADTVHFDRYLRFPDACLLAPAEPGSARIAVLLMSELEADRILGALQRMNPQQAQSCSLTFANWSLLRYGDARTPLAFSGFGRQPIAASLGETELAALQLFLGEATLARTEGEGHEKERERRVQAVARLLRRACGSEKCVRALLQMRRAASQYDRKREPRWARETRERMGSIEAMLLNERIHRRNRGASARGRSTTWTVLRKELSALIHPGALRFLLLPPPQPEECGFHCLKALRSSLRPRPQRSSLR